MDQSNTNSESVLVSTLQDILDSWPAGRQRIHLPAPLGLGGSQDWYHFHLYPEIFIQLGGYSDFRFPKDRLTLNTGDILIVPRFLPHNEIMCDTEEPFLNLVVMPTGRYIGLHLARRAMSSKARIIKESQRRFRSESVPVVMACCDEASRLLHHPVIKDRQEAVDAMIRAALISLESMVTDHLQIEQVPQGRIDRCCDLIEMNLTSHGLSVNELARWLDCHPDYLSTSFRQERGHTVIDHICERRIELAAGLLADTDLRVAEIAWACGFQDPAYFSRRFKQKRQVSPQSYREHSHGD